MLFKSIKPCRLLVFLSLISMGCGALGDREDFDTLIRYAGDSTGCLNDFGNQAKNFLKGKANPSDWKKVFDCQIDSLELFQKFIAGSDNGNYTVEDIHALTTKILITNSDVSKTLIRTLFQLKASLLGGDHRRITPKELELISDLFRLLRDESTNLIPFLREHSENSSPLGVTKLADQISVFGYALGGFFIDENRESFSDNDIFTLIKELKKIFKWEFKTDSVDVFMYLKSYLISGSSFEIEGFNWNKIIDTVSNGFGIYFLFSEMKSKEKFNSPDEYESYLRNIALKIRHLFLRGIQRNGGSISISQFDALIDALPNRFLLLSNGLDIDKTILKEALRPTFEKLFQSGKKEAFTSEVIETLYRSFDKWNRGQSHLEKIFKSQNLNKDSVGVSAFRKAAIDYSSGLDARAVNDVVRLIKLVETYRPLFKVGTSQIGLNQNFKHSLYSLSKFHWMNLAVEHLMDIYAADPVRNIGTIDDFVAIFDDFGWLLFELGVSDPRVENVAKRRFREANLFTHGSNGDEFFNEEEGTYYIASLLSIKDMASEMLDLTQGPCKIGDEKDDFGFYPMDTNCFRSYYYANIKHLWRHKPHLLEWYQGLDEAGKLEFNIAAEEASRALGYSQLPVTSYDVDIWAGMTLYIEILFERFDKNGSNRLETEDILRAYPVFKQTIATIGGLDPKDDGMIEAVFTYIVFYGEIPESNLLGSINFIWWKLKRPWWNIKAYRTDIYKIVSFFSTD